MTEKRSTTKRPFAAKKAMATGMTIAAAGAKAPTVRKATSVASEKKTPRKKPPQTMTADTESQKPAPTQRRATGAKKAPAKLSAEERYRMIQSAAYFLAEKDGFQGPATHYWTLAEWEIAAHLGESEAQG